MHDRALDPAPQQQAPKRTETTAGARPRRGRVARRPVDEQGSLVLDILIGMAIFALIAIIAVSAIGQYRARAYEQSAVSDAGALGLAVFAAASDGQPVDPQPVPGNPGAVQVGDSRVTLSHQGKTAILNFVAPTQPDGGFSYCVVHDGTHWAQYDSSRGGLVDSGRASVPAACR